MSVGGRSFAQSAYVEGSLIWYVKHRLRDKSVETFRCNVEAKAHGICRDLREAGEVAWVEDEQGRTVQELGGNR
jgi:hypothetical protein